MLKRQGAANVFPDMRVLRLYETFLNTPGSIRTRLILEIDKIVDEGTVEWSDYLTHVAEYDPKKAKIYDNARNEFLNRA